MRVTVVAPPESAVAGWAYDAGAHVIVDDLKTRRPLTAAWRLVGHLRAVSADIVHGTSPLTNVLARIAGPHAGARVVDALHTEPNSTLAFRTGLRARASQVARDAADAITRTRSDVSIADSATLRAAYIARGLHPDRVEIVHNAVEPDLLRARGEAARADAMHDDASTLRIGTVGRLEPVKGLDVLLSAVLEVAISCPSARLSIAGVGPELAALQARIEKDDVLRPRVACLGFVEHLPAFLSTLDVYCLASLSEGFNTTILEAMALGVPVVATDVRGRARPSSTTSRASW